MSQNRHSEQAGESYEVPMLRMRENCRESRLLCNFLVSSVTACVFVRGLLSRRVETAWRGRHHDNIELEMECFTNACVQQSSKPLFIRCLCPKRRTILPTARSRRSGRRTGFAVTLFRFGFERTYFLCKQSKFFFFLLSSSFSYRTNIL